MQTCPIPHVHRTLLQVERCWGCGVAGTLTTPPREWTGGFAALCDGCQRPLMTDEELAGLCERCSLANAEPCVDNVSPNTLAELDEAIDEQTWFVEEARRRLRETEEQITAGEGDWLRVVFADASLSAERAYLDTLTRYRMLRWKKD